MTDNPVPAAQLAALSDIDGQHVNVVETESVVGLGAVINSERVTGRVAFRRLRLRKQGLIADQCSVIPVVDASMEPTLLDGFSNLVRWEQRNPQGWRQMSANPQWPPMALTAGTDIIGEVRWMARTL